MKNENRISGSNKSEHKQTGKIMGERDPNILGIDKEYFEQKQKEEMKKNEDQE